jgi:formyl-CoA transferase
MSSIFLAVNRNKRGLSIDLTKPEGAAALQRLVPTCDVFMHNMRVDAIERLGFGYDKVARLKSDIVYCVATGFDQDGPDAGKPAFDDIVQAASGLVALTSIGRAEPAYVPNLIADKTTGLAMLSAVLAALVHRGRTGKGQYIEVPMLETMAGFVLAEHMAGLTFVPPTSPPGYARLLEGGRKPAPTKDGHIALLPYTANHWRAFFEAAGRSDLAKELAVDDRAKRNARIRELYANLAEITKTRTTREWMEICTLADVPATPIYSLADLPEHPQLKASGLFQTFAHPSEGEIRYTRPSAKFSATPANVRRGAPLLGEHSAEILREAGLEDAQIGSLVEKGIVKQAAREREEKV